VGEDALKVMGELGQLLIKRIGAAKELSYLDDYLGRTETRDTIHPSFKMPGTVTGRLAGKEPNLQQVPKTVGTLSGFVSRPGHSFVDCDVNALEMVVTTELSQDKNLLALYGPGAKKNDIYLFYASFMPILGPKIKATGYDPYNPTSETIARAKKECKSERSIAKLLILSDNYGSGIGKKQKILRLNGVDMTYNEVSDMHEALLAAKEGVMRYVARLEDEWRYNKGWIYNGYGRPIAVHESKKKDLLNRVVQGTGHDILQLYSRITAQLLTEAGITWQPIVMDWHDESIVEVPDEEVPEARHIMEHEAYRILNETLGGTCPLKGSAAVAKSLTGLKIEE
jgi:DNA polymerase-1